MKKRFILLLCLALMLGTVPAALAANGPTPGPESYLNTPESTKSEIESWDGPSEVITSLSEDGQSIVDRYRDRGVTIRKLIVGRTPLFEAYRDDGTKKPLVFLIHGGGGHKDPAWAGDYALMGFHAVSFDVPSCGESTVKPLPEAASWAEAVRDIDALVEYYNAERSDSVDASTFALHGTSMGGTISYCYAAHGKYRPTAIAPVVGTPDLRQVGEAYKRLEGTGWDEDDVRKYVEGYSPDNRLERFRNLWVLAGGGDNDPSCAPQQQFADRLRAIGADEKFSYTAYPGAGHGAPDSHYQQVNEFLRGKLLGEDPGPAPDGRAILQIDGVNYRAEANGAVKIEKDGVLSDAAWPKGVSYDYGSNRLRLEGANLHSLKLRYKPEGTPEEVEPDFPRSDLTLEIKGENTIAAAPSNRTDARADFNALTVADGLRVHLRGGGTLHVSAESRAGDARPGIAIDVSRGSHLILEGVRLDARVSGGSLEGMMPVAVRIDRDGGAPCALIMEDGELAASADSVAVELKDGEFRLKGGRAELTAGGTALNAIDDSSISLEGGRLVLLAMGENGSGLALRNEGGRLTVTDGQHTFGRPNERDGQLLNRGSIGILSYGSVSFEGGIADLFGDRSAAEYNFRLNGVEAVDRPPKLRIPDSMALILPDQDGRTLDGPNFGWTVQGDRQVFFLTRDGSKGQADNMDAVAHHLRLAPRSELFGLEKAALNGDAVVVRYRRLAGEGKHSLLCAFYKENGQSLDLKILPVSQTNDWNEAKFEGAPTGTAYAKIFLLDGSFAPLCDAADTRSPAGQNQ